MMQADVTVTPIRAVHLAVRAGEMGKVVPVIALAGHVAWVAPIVVAVTVGGVVYGTAFRLARILLVVAGEARVQVGIAREVLVNLGHDRFAAVGEGLQHFTYAALQREAHGEETLRGLRGARQ